LPERPQTFRTPDEATTFVADNPQFTPPPEITSPTAATAWVNAARLADYQQQVGRARAETITNFAASQPETFLNNLAQAAGEGRLGNLTKFTANDVANAALRSSGIEPGRLTKEERQFVSEQLNNLANAGILAKPTATSFSVSFGPRRQAAEAAPETPVTRSERAAAQRDVAELTAAAEAGTVEQITPFEARRLGVTGLASKSPAFC
jgi:hypothetical protein